MEYRAMCVLFFVVASLHCISGDGISLSSSLRLPFIDFHRIQCNKWGQYFHLLFYACHLFVPNRENENEKEEKRNKEIIYLTVKSLYIVKCAALDTSSKRSLIKLYFLSISVSHFVKYRRKEGKKNNNNDDKMRVKNKVRRWKTSFTI